MTIAMIPKM